LRGFGNTGATVTLRQSAQHMQQACRRQKKLSFHLSNLFKL
jgi:hypothetical protein